MEVKDSNGNILNDGDSVQVIKDPEVYGEIARSHPDQVVRIFIRDVSGSDASKERLERAFRDVGPDRWRVFKDAVELQGVVIES